MKKLLFASSDYLIKGTINECMKESFPHVAAYDVTKDCDIKFHIAVPEETVLLIDKFFLGYHLYEKLKMLKTINPKLRIVFVEKEICSVFFAMRVYNLETDGYIANVENMEMLKKNLCEIFSGRKYFPDIVKDEISRGGNLDTRNCDELTDSELNVAVMLGKGMSVKEIAYVLKTNSHNVSNFIVYIRRKIGWKTDADFKELYDHMLDRDLGGWAC